MNITSKINEVTYGFEIVSKQGLIDVMLEMRNGAHTNGSVIVASVPKMNKTGNPFFGRVTKLAKWSCGVNTEYATKINNKLERIAEESGQPKAEYTFNESVYVKYNVGQKNCPVLRLKKDESKIYLALFPNKSVSFVEYYIDGVLATEFQMEQLKAWLPDTKVSQKQLEAGIQAEEQVPIRITSVDSVVGVVFDKCSYRVM